MIRFLKLKFSLLLLILTVLSSAQVFANTIPSDYWEKGRRLSDFTLFDAYRLKSSDPVEQKNFGTLLFLYRDLATCRGTDICRRLVMAWISPDNRVVELQIPEQAFFSNRLKRNDLGTGLGNNNEFVIPTPAALNFLGPIIISSHGPQGEKLDLTFKPPGYIMGYFFERVSGALFATIRGQLNMKDPSDPNKTTPNYFPPFEDVSKELKYAVYFKTKDPSSGYIISIPGPGNYLSEWQLTEFKLALSGKSSYFSAPFLFSSSEVDHLQFSSNPGYKVKITHHDKFLNTARSYFAPGVGQILVPKQNELVIENDKLVLGSEDETQAVLSEYTIHSSAMELKEPPSDPFYEMLHNSVTCSSLLHPSANGGPGSGKTDPSFNVNNIPIGSSIGHRHHDISLHP